MPVEANAAAMQTKLECMAPSGWSAVRARKAAYVIFGEIHGTREAPSFVAQIACAEALAGRTVLVAIELNVADNARLKRAWDLPAGQFDLALGQIGWLNRKDGIASKAMFSLIVRLHALKEIGLPVAVTFYAGFRDKDQFDRLSNLSGQGPYEAALAENIYEAARRGGFASVIILTGNFHAMVTPVVRGVVKFEPMALKLAAFGQVISLDMRYDSGSSWNCRLQASQNGSSRPINQTDIVCGAVQTEGTERSATNTLISLDDPPAGSRQRDFDGTFWVGAISSSPPMFTM